MKVYIELTHRSTGLTQIGYFKDTASYVPKSKVIMLPFSLVDEIEADNFNSEPEAAMAINAALRTLNWGYVKALKVEFREARNEK